MLHRWGLLENNRQQPKSGGWKHSLKLNFLRGFTGWRVSVLLWASVAAVVCTLNIVLTVWASKKNHVVDGVSYLYTGSSTKTARMSFWLHIGSNVLSTLLFSASNCKRIPKALSHISLKSLHPHSPPFRPAFYTKTTNF